MKTSMKFTQNQVAKTIAELLQFDYQNPRATGEVMSSIFKDVDEQKGKSTGSGAAN